MKSRKQIWLFCLVAFLPWLASCNDVTGPVTKTETLLPSLDATVTAGVVPQISAGGYHSCAIRVDGSPACWGSNDYGQISIPAGLGAVTQISAGNDNTCALKSNGTVRCWGNNALGQSTVPTGLTGVVSVKARRQFVCALKSNGTVVCWGSDSEGQASPPSSLQNVVGISTGAFHACSVGSGGTVNCWGRDSTGQSSVPTSARSGVSEVAVGGWHSCALKTSSAVLCWGLDTRLQTTPPRNLKADEITAGTDWTCAINTAAAVVCWGANVHQQTKVPSSLNKNVEQIWAGGYHTCAVRADGLFVCWGLNDRGQSNVPTWPQAISFAAVSAAAVGGTDTLRATGGPSGSPVTFKSLTPSVCRVSGSVVSFFTVGKCTLAANQGAGGNYSAAPQVTQTVTVGSLSQTITFTSTPPDPALAGGTYYVKATGGASGNPVTFSSLTPSTCTVTDSTVALAAVGQCTIGADQAGGNGYTAAPQATQSFPIVAASQPQSITFTSTPSNPAYAGGTYIVRATGGGSGNPVTFSTLTPSVCTVTDSTVTLVTAGQCTIAANQAGGNGYNAAPQATQSFPIVAASQPQSITFTSTPSNPAYAGGTYIVKATGGGSGNPVTFSTLTPSVCTVTDSTVSLVTAGQCTIAANQAGGNGYDAAPQATQSFPIVAASQPQSISFTSTPPNPGLSGGTYIVKATGGGSGNPVTFSTLTPSMCTVSDSTVTLVAAGQCTIAANQAGGNGYDAAPQATQSFSISAYVPLPAQTLSAGWFHTCTLESGSIICWGADEYNQSTPLTGTGFTEVSAGGYHACALRSNGTVSCWGNNGEGGAPAVQNAPGGNTFVQVSSGANHTCALVSNGTIACWGYDGYGQAPAIRTAPAGTTFTQVSAGGYHTCGRVSNGTIMCWGRNDNGQIDVPAGSSFVEVRGGAFHTCARRIDGTLTCWGANNLGQTVAPSGNTYVQATGGGFHTCGLKSDGNISCSGSNNYGQSTPPAAAPFAQVTAGYYHTCARKSDGTVICWGSNDKGQSMSTQTISFTTTPPSPAAVGATYSVAATGGKSGNPVSFSSQSSSVCTVSGSTVTLLAAGQCTIAANQAAGIGYSAAPQATQSFPVTGDAPVAVQNVSAGWFHTCSLANGAITCWGANEYGQSTPVAGTGFTEVASGGYHSCALKTDGTIRCWGNNGEGGAPAIQNAPAGMSFVQVTAGSNHSCALVSNGTISCWGADVYGNAPATQTAPAGKTFKQVSAGGQHTCGLVSDGTLMCWGRNDNGQINAPAGSNFVEVRGGAFHTCARLVGGTLTCWGANNLGQSIPPSGNTFVQAAGGGFHSCGLKSDGSIACSGSNNYGQSTPPATTLFTQATAGYYHTCGRKSDGTVACWGSNDRGQSMAP